MAFFLILERFHRSPSSHSLVCSTVVHTFFCCCFLLVFLHCFVSLGSSSPDGKKKTFRKTQVIVIPGHPGLLQNFTVFDAWMESINKARRNARDYVLDQTSHSGRSPNNENDNWSVSVSCAHLHPKFGELTPYQQLQQLQQEDKDGEIDMNYREYQERKVLARRSPYPTLVLEVRAMPAPDFGAATPPPPTTASIVDRDVTRDDIRRLEALFGKSAAVRPHPTTSIVSSSEDDFYNAIGQSLDVVSSIPPLQQVQEWMVMNDPGLKGVASAAFTESDSPHIDAAYEFLFANLAMMRESRTKRQYLVMPRLVPQSATSLEKFAQEASHLITSVPGFTDPNTGAPKVRLHPFHPEHIQPERRSPVPVLLLELITDGSSTLHKDGA